MIRRPFGLIAAIAAAVAPAAIAIAAPTPVPVAIPSPKPQVSPRAMALPSPRPYPVHAPRAMPLPASGSHAPRAIPLPAGKPQALPSPLPAPSVRRSPHTPPAPPPVPAAPSVPPAPFPSPHPWTNWSTPAPTESVAPLKPGPVPGAVRLLSQMLTYDRKASLAVLTGAVKIYQEDTTIETEKLRHDSKMKISYIEVPFKLRQEKPGEPLTNLEGKQLTFYHNEKRIYVEGDVKLTRHGNPDAQPEGAKSKDKLKAALKREDTFIESQKMMYWTDRKDADFKDTVVAYQKEKRAEGDHAFMDKAKGKIFMDGHVVLTQIKGDWLVDNGIVDTSKPDEERDKAIKEKTVAKGDQLEIDQVTNDSVLTGNLVTIDQKDRHATGRRAVFSDKDQTMTLTENVQIKRDSGDWINAERAVFHTNNDKFEAFGGQGGQVETQFKLEDKK